jgi:hypothetical protein
MPSPTGPGGVRPEGVMACKAVCMTAANTPILSEFSVAYFILGAQVLMSYFLPVHWGGAKFTHKLMVLRCCHMATMQPLIAVTARRALTQHHKADSEFKRRLVRDQQRSGRASAGWRTSAEVSPSALDSRAIHRVPLPHLHVPAMTPLTHSPHTRPIIQSSNPVTSLASLPLRSQPSRHASTRCPKRYCVLCSWVTVR